MTSPIIGFIGRRGSGKTLLQTIFIRKAVIANALAGIATTIYSNYDLFMDDIDGLVVHKLDKDMFNHLFGEEMGCFRLKNAIFAFDEIAAYTDAYNWMKSETKRLAMFALQSRKRKVNIFYTAQFPSLVPVRIRRSTEMMIYPEFDKEKDMISYDIFDFNGVGQLYLKTRMVDSVSRYFPMYDTDQTIEIL